MSQLKDILQVALVAIILLTLHLHGIGVFTPSGWVVFCSWALIHIIRGEDLMEASNLKVVHADMTTLYIGDKVNNGEVVQSRHKNGNTIEFQVRVPKGYLTWYTLEELNLKVVMR